MKNPSNKRLIFYYWDFKIINAIYYSISIASSPLTIDKATRSGDRGN